MKGILILFISLLVSSCGMNMVYDKNFDSKVDLPPKLKNKIYSKAELETIEAGKCYAECLIGDEYESESLNFYEFTGDLGLENVEIYTSKLIIEPSKTKWIQKVKPNCNEVKSEECKIWYLEKSDEILEEIHGLKDTSQTDNFYLRTVEHEVLVNKGGYSEWREIVCNDDISDELLDEIKDELINLGYSIKSQSSRENISYEFKNVLIDFQRDNHLPIGNFDIETLELLGIEVEQK